MPAYEIPNLRFSGVAAEPILRRRFVTINEDEQVLMVSGSTDNIVGVSSQPNEKAGEVAEIYDGIVMVEAGAAVVAGSAVMSDSEARAIPFAAGEGTALQAGVAITNAGAAGELVSVKIY